MAVLYRTTVHGVMALLAALGSGSVLTASPRQQGDELERLRVQLAAPGPDGKDSREGAIERILVLPRLTAHELLHACLRQTDDPDQVRLAIATSLQRHFLLPAASLFGGATGAERERILAGYLVAIARTFRDQRTTVLDAGDDPVRTAARAALQRVAPRDLAAAARSASTTASLDEQIDVLRCLADLQQTLFAATIAESLEAQSPQLREAARAALQLLTCYEHPIRDKAEFAAWQQTFGTWRYVDLVERAARRGSRPLELLQQRLSEVQVTAACDVVRAHVTRTPGIDWAAVQARVVVDDTAVLDACLDILQLALQTAAIDVTSPARQSFCRALLQRHLQTPPEERRRRALLLEVAAYLGHPDEAELATEIVALLTAEASADDPASRISALRGLRRFPSVENRGRLVTSALRLLAAEPVAHGEVAVILQALTSRTAPRWTAPAPSDADKADWLQLMSTCCRSEESLELREAALQMAQVLDPRDLRVPEVFQLLLVLVRDQELSTKFRATCAIHLQGWRNESGLAEAWLRAFHELLQDQAPELRQQAAEALAGLATSIDSRRGEWLAATILLLRDRFGVEQDPVVLRSMLECLQVIGCEPGMPERAIGALRLVLGNLGNPVPPEHQFRLEPLLSALATVAAHSRADRGQWLAACDYLSTHKRRQSLRLILQNHAAVDLAKDVAASEPGVARRAREAMRFLLETAAMKSPREAWSSSEELQRELRDVRTAFLAFDAVEEAQRPDSAALRVLRLESDLVAGKPQDVVQRATAWLENSNGGRVTFGVDDKNRIRTLAAEAQLQLGRGDAARKLLEERTGEPESDAAELDLEARVARAIAGTELANAVEWLGRVVRRTPNDDATFRARLVEWMQLRLRLDPAARDTALRELEQHAPLFQAADCPADVRAAFEQLRAQ